MTTEMNQKKKGQRGIEETRPEIKNVERRESETRFRKKTREAKDKRLCGEKFW